MPRSAFLPAHASIDAYGNGGFRFAGMSHQGSLLILPSGIYGWDVSDLESLKPEDFDLVRAEASKIDFFILGTGTTTSIPPAQIRDAFRGSTFSFDWMNTGAAVRTYNVLFAEERQAAAGLIAVRDSR